MIKPNIGLELRSPTNQIYSHRGQIANYFLSTRAQESRGKSLQKAVQNSSVQKVIEQLKKNMKAVQQRFDISHLKRKEKAIPLDQLIRQSLNSAQKLREKPSGVTEKVATICEENEISE